jgi:signal transduction histidine kinase
MPALAKTPATATLPRFVPHGNYGADAGAGDFSKSAPKPGPGPDQRRPPATVSETPLNNSSNPDRLAHDARNVLSGLMLYCELLSYPGVLTKSHRHFAQELQSIAQNATQIVERMASAQNAPAIAEKQAHPAASSSPLAAAPVTAVPVTDLAYELLQLKPLLAAVAGPATRLSIATMPCSGRTALAVEDLTRILVNLVRNAADAMPSGGHIRITAQYGEGLSFLDPAHTELEPAYDSPRSVVLTVTDNGPGIPESLRDKIFDPGFTTRKQTGVHPTPRRRGLGLEIVRNLVEAAGGTVRLASRPMRGARFEISLPLPESITSGMYATSPNNVFPADSRTKDCLECH